MNYPHLYIKSLLQEVNEENKSMIKLHNDYSTSRFMNRSPDESLDIYKHMENKSLYIEQLNQEIVNTIKSMETK